MGPSSGPNKQNEPLSSQQWVSTPQHRQVTDLCHATTGSAALDLPAIDPVVLQPCLGVIKVRTGIYGRLEKGTIGLIFGQTSLTLKGIHGHPGVID
ncbi:neutral protease large subunit, partial [Lynx pardinus]